MALAAAPSVTLAFSYFLKGGPRYVECATQVQPGWNMLQVLDAATGGCIFSWSWDSGSPNVRCVDEQCGPGGWQLYVNNIKRSGTFWLHQVAGGERVDFVETDLGLNLT